MSDYLVIVESPSKAKTIKKFLGPKYEVLPSVGHLRDLPKSRIAVDLDNNFEPQYINIRGKAQTIKDLKKAAAAAKKVYLATDPDREGEAISWHLQYILGIADKDVCRVPIHEITQTAVKEAIANPRAIDRGLVDAYQARRVLDRIVGYKISPILWKKVKKGLSAGRVQSVVTRLICDREEEIDAFIPKEYWTIDAKLRKQAEKPLKKYEFVAKFFGDKNGKINVENEAEALKIKNAVSDAEFKVTSVKNGEKKRSPFAPFTTSTLQQEASRKLGFTTSRTMRAAQQIFEGIDLGKSAGGLTGLVTYIRTDSVRISSDAANAAEKYIKENFGDSYLPKSRRFYKNKNSAQDAHEAIRPVNLDLKPEKLSSVLQPDLYKIYKLIFERFVASQMADCVYNTSVAEIKAAGYVFKASGSTVKFPGFTSVYAVTIEGDEEEAGTIPELTEGETPDVLGIKEAQHFTQPPARYTEGSLVKAMEEYGIGRPSTYASIVSTIQARGYVGKEKRTLFPTELGKIVNTIMKQSFEEIVDVDFTAHMEEELDRVEENVLVWNDVIREFYNGFEPKLHKAEQEVEKVVIQDPVSDVVCDKCGRLMVYKTGKYGKFLACPGFPECRNTKTIVEEAGIPCPDCGKMLIYRKTKSGRKYVTCSGYPDCKFNSWNIPTDRKCPKCGSRMDIIMNRKNYLICSNNDCKYTHKKDS